MQLVTVSFKIPDDQVKAKVENGWVTLTGEVDWEFQKNAARNAIQILKGVVGITNGITVKNVALVKDVKQKIAAAFHRSATIDSAKVKVEISGSKAILSGSVRSWAERDEAEKAAWNAQGITAVENDLAIA
jgi:osmotically-inducible protein OsmY